MAEAVFKGRIACRLDPQVNALGKKSPTFSRYSYLDQEGKLQIGNPVSKFIRTSLISINTLIVSMGSVIGVVLGIAIGYIGHPFFGAFFFACMTIGAWVQSSAFGQRRAYGVWRGSCPHCEEPLKISARKAETKTVSCAMCTRRVTLNNELFRLSPWYAS